MKSVSSFSSIDMAGKKSAVWNFFELLMKDGTEDKTLTDCNNCKRQIKYLSGSTLSITAHILRRHGITLSKTKGKNREKFKLYGELLLPEALGFKHKYVRSSTRQGPSVFS